jgi:GT2 family glycosyltransferase
VKRLTVVVLNWNGLEDTRALLATLERCRVPEGWSVSVMVVDNGSSDGSAARIAAEFPQVDVLALPANLRFAGGNNRGVQRAL